VRFIEASQLLDNPPAHHPEVAGVRRNIDVAETRDDCIADVRYETFEQRLAGARAPFGVDDIEALAEPRDHLRNKLWGILQINIDHTAYIAAAIENSGHGGGWLPKPAREDQQFHGRIARDLSADDRFGLVGGWIEAEYHLPGASHRRERFLQPFEEGADAGLLLVDRNDH